MEIGPSASMGFKAEVKVEVKVWKIIDVKIEMPLFLVEVSSAYLSLLIKKRLQQKP